VENMKDGGYLRPMHTSSEAEGWRKAASQGLTTISPNNPRAVDIVREQTPLPGVLKGCRDCCYVSGNLCTHPSVGDIKLDVFTGKVLRHNFPQFKKMRTESGLCGPEARLWAKVKPVANFRVYTVLSWVSLMLTAFLIFGVGTWWGLVGVPLMLAFMATRAILGSE
jgi:hypothetical protein